MEYVVDLIWDNEASVWIAVSDDVKGMALEFESLEGLIERVKLATPELLWLNNVSIPETIILSFRIRCEVNTAVTCG